MNKYSWIALLCLATAAHAQDFASPSLAAGVGKVVYEQGKLDAETVAQLIATKQDEVKKELMKRWVLKATQGGSLLVQNFIQQNLELLMSDASADVKKKELLRNAAELALVLGIAEFYMTEIQRSEKRTTEENAFLLSYMLHLDQSSKAAFIKTFFRGVSISLGDISAYAKGNRVSIVPTQLEDGVKQCYFAQSRTMKGTKLSFSRKTQKKQSNFVFADKHGVDIFDNTNPTSITASAKYLPKLELITDYKNRTMAGSERNDFFSSNVFNVQFGQGIVSPNHILLDMVYKICTESSRIRDLGFFQRLDINRNEFKWRNKYTQFEGTQLYTTFHPIELEIKSRIDIIFNYFIPFENIVNGVAHQGGTASIDLNAVSDLKVTLLNTRVLNSYTLSGEEQELIKNISIILDKDAFFTKLNSLQSTTSGNVQSDLSSFNDFIYYLKDKALPALSVLNAKTAGSYSQLQTDLKALTVNFENYLHLRIGRITFPVNVQEYASLINTVSNLDKVETYDKIIKFIADVGNLYSDTGVGNIVNSFVNAYDKYASIDKGKNKINIDVESVAVDLFDRYGKNSKSDISLYFTVGVNNAVSHNKLISKDGVDSAKYFTYVGEKIGLKVRLPKMNFTKKRALLNYPHYNYTDSNKKNRIFDNSRPPLISDVHVLFYGSGLLYQIQQLNSNSKVFNNPIAGIAMGISFFNGLDFNFGYAAQLGNAKDFLWNAGFDINFTEYLSALKKKKSNQ